MKNINNSQPNDLVRLLFYPFVFCLKLTLSSAAPLTVGLLLWRLFSEVIADPKLALITQLNGFALWAVLSLTFFSSLLGSFLIMHHAIENLFNKTFGLDSFLIKHSNKNNHKN